MVLQHGFENGDYFETVVVEWREYPMQRKLHDNLVAAPLDIPLAIVF